MFIIMEKGSLGDTSRLQQQVIQLGVKQILTEGPTLELSLSTSGLFVVF